MHSASAPDQPSASARDDQPSASAHDDVVAPDRLDALLGCDSGRREYDPDSWRMVFSCRGRYASFWAGPLTALVLWFVAWGLVFEFSEPAKEWFAPLEGLVGPLLTPVSFLLVFRLGRAAVRFWDARAALGLLVEISRTFFGAVAVYCADQPQHREEIARWLCCFPIAVKNFLRPKKQNAWKPMVRCPKTRLEIGRLLPEADALHLLGQRDRTEEEPIGAETEPDPERFGAPAAPLLVLVRLRQLVHAAVATSSGTGEPALAAAAYRQLNTQLDLLTKAWGAMERINSTPLPYAYVVHLRTFLLLYLLMWSVDSLARHGWAAMPTLIAASWALLGVEAASVTCERPFRWEANHLALGRTCVVVANNVGQMLRDVGERRVVFSFRS